MRKRIGAIIAASVLSVTMTAAGAFAADTAATGVPTESPVMATTSSRLIKDSEIICYLGEGQVTASMLNVRSDPSTSYSVRGKLSKGTWVSMYCTTKDKEGWFYIIKGNIDGFVSGQYIGNVDPASLNEES